MKRLALCLVLCVLGLFFARDISAADGRDLTQIGIRGTEPAHNLQFPGRPFDVKAAIAEESECAGDPVNKITGCVETYPQVDFVLYGIIADMVFARTYYSISEYDGPFGYGWTYSYNIALSKENDEIFTVMDEDGKIHVFAFSPDKREFEPMIMNTYSLVRQLQNPGEPRPIYKMICTVKDGTKYIFPDAFWNEPRVVSHVSAIEYNDGTTIKLLPDDGSLPTQIVDRHGRVIRLSYSDGRITEIFEPGRPADRPIRYSYDDHGNLTLVSYPVTADTTYTRRYYYEDPSDPHNMTRWEDEHGFWRSYKYDSNGRCIMTQGEDIGEGPLYKYLFQYKPEDQETRITRCRGKEKFVEIANYNGMMLIQKRRFVDSGEIEKYTYHFKQGGESTKEVTEINPAQSSIFKKVVRYDEKFNITGIAVGTTKTQGDTPDTLQIKVSYDDPDNPATPTSIKDQNGNPLNITPDAFANIEALFRVKEAEALGQPLNIKPFIADDKDEATKKEQEWKVVPDEHGLTRKMTDDAGNSVEFLYDGAGRCICFTETRGNEETKTQFDCDWLGRITRVTLTEPNGDSRSESYEYDAADKFHPQANYAINKIAFNGEKTQYLYDRGGFLWKVIEFRDGVMPSVTTYEHDSFGNLIKLILPDGRTITATYDSRDRLIGVQGPLSVLNRVWS